MNTNITDPNLFVRIKDKQRRDAFVLSQVNKGTSFQLRALRAARNYTQQKMAELAGTTQTVISRIENNGAGNLSVKSLLNLASALDVALVVRFEPIDKLINWVNDLSPEVLTPKSSEEIILELEKKSETVIANNNSAFKDTPKNTNKNVLNFPKQTPVLAEIGTESSYAQIRLPGILEPVQNPKPRKTKQGKEEDTPLPIALPEDQTIGAYLYPDSRAYAA